MTSVSYHKKLNSMIQPHSDDQQEYSQYKNSLSNVNSAKNLHQLKHFNFTQASTCKNEQKIKKQCKIQKLQKEKEQLIKSLQILKNGAVSAIVEKDQIIEKLRKLFNQMSIKETEDKDESRMQQFQMLLERIKQLQEDRNQLKKEIDRKHQLYLQQIQEREQIINKLTNELNWSVDRIDSLQKYDKLLEEKIKVIEEDNQNLNVMLNHSQTSLRDQRRKHSEQHELLKNKSMSSIIHGGSDSQNGSVSFANRFGHESQILNISRSLDQSSIQNRIQKLKREHQIQIQDLTDFYQSRIQSLKKVWQQYPQLPLTATNTHNQQKQFGVNLIYDFNQNRSNNSNFTNETLEKEQKKNHEHILKKNLSLGSLKSGMFSKMDPIDQKQQIESPACSLKKQICMNYKKKPSYQRASSQSSIKSQSSQGNNVQNQSQFSYKYFEYPSPSFKKSKGQISRGNSQQNSPTKFPQKYKNSAIKIKQLQKSAEEFKSSKDLKEKTNALWDKFFWFASGTLTGTLILSVGAKIFK